MQIDCTYSFELCIRKPITTKKASAVGQDFFDNTLQVVGSNPTFLSKKVAQSDRVVTFKKNLSACRLANYMGECRRAGILRSVNSEVVGSNPTSPSGE